MRKTGVIWASILAVICLISYVGISLASEESRDTVGVSPEVVADYIHSVIEADRTLYTTHVVQRMQEGGIVIAAEAWKRRNALPLRVCGPSMRGMALRPSSNELDWKRLRKIRPNPIPGSFKEGTRVISKPFTRIGRFPKLA